MDILNQQITQIIKNIWQIMFSSPVEPKEIEQQAYPFSIIGSIQIHGAWNGSVFVYCCQNVMSELASHSLGIEEHVLKQTEIMDTMSEVTYLIGGNIKPFLPSPSELSLPQVYFVAEDCKISNQSLINRVDMMVNKGVLRVELLATSSFN
jgi:hypothetical protein